MRFFGPGYQKLLLLQNRRFLSNISNEESVSKQNYQIKYIKKNRITIRYLSLSHIHGDEGDNVGVPNMNSIQDICKTNNSQKFTIN